MGEKDVFWLDVPVGVALAVHVVETIHHLVEVGPGDLFCEFSGIGDVVEELSSADVLEDDGETLVLGFVSAFVGGIFPNVDEFHEVVMVEDLHYTELVLQGVQIRSLFLISLDGHVSSIVVHSQLHSKIKSRLTVRGTLRRGSSKS